MVNLARRYGGGALLSQERQIPKHVKVEGRSSLGGGAKQQPVPGMALQGAPSKTGSSQPSSSATGSGRTMSLLETVLEMLLLQ